MAASRNAAGFPDREAPAEGTSNPRRKGPAIQTGAGLFLSPAASENDVDEAHEMTRLWEALERPAGLDRTAGRGDCELVRAGRAGTYWQAADGLVVRVAAAEDAHGSEAAQRALLALAVLDASAQGSPTGAPDDPAG
jgi:hypothetical protein